MSNFLRPLFFEARQEAKVSDLVPFSHIEGDTLICKDGSRSRVYRLGGIDHASQLLGAMHSLTVKRLDFFNYLSKLEVQAKFITFKRRIATSRKAVSHINPIAQRIEDRWHEHTKSEYALEHFLSLSITPQKLTSLTRSFEEVEETLDFIEDYHPTLLKNTKPYSELLEFCLYLTSRSRQRVASAKSDIDDYLTQSPITMNLKTGVIQYEDMSPSFEKVLSLSRWGETSRAEILETLFRKAGEMIVVHTIEGLSKQKAKRSLRKPRTMFKTDKQVEEEMVAIELMDNDESQVQTYQLNIFVRGRSVEDVEEHTRTLRRHLSDYGIISTLETSGIHYAYLNQFPCVQDLKIRPTTVMSHNLSHFIVPSKEPKGLTHCSFGAQATQYFKTLGGASYPFCFHKDGGQNSLGHSLIVAPTGAGKTTLFSHLTLGLLKYENMRCLLLDRFHGLKVFTTLIGGSYQSLGEEGLEFNPLLIQNTVSDRKRLHDFLKILVSKRGDDGELVEFVDHVLTTPIENRTLSALFDEGLKSKSTGGMSELKQALEPWAKGSLKEWFNGMRDGKAYDTLSFDQTITTIDMTDVLKDEELALPLTSYLLSSLQGYVRDHANPHFVLIDECFAMAKNPLFKTQVLEPLIYEQRKLNGCVGMCFQGVHQIDQLGLVESLSDNTATKFLFPLSKGPKRIEEIYRDGFGVGDVEWEYLTNSRKITASGFKHTVLVKKEDESVVLDIDLSPLGELLKVYSSDAADVKKLDTLKGDEKCINQFLAA